MPEGVQYPDVIDKVMTHKDGTVLLVMREDRPWDGSQQRTKELQQKIKNYAAFARQGQLATDFPDSAGKPVAFELWCIQHRPDAHLMHLLDRANAQLAQHALRIGVRVIEVDTPNTQQEGFRQSKPWWKIW